ncbi:MAG TPA: prephenate dehydratase [Candidatus Acidoferrum sp.]|nr:prephenate dehydratase [Candidatus Acidoferrum sp.]
MAETGKANLRIAFQGECGAFSEAAAIQLLGENIVTVPRPTFDSAFHAIDEGAADALLAPVENSLAGSVVRVYDLLLDSELTMVAETILPIEMQLIGCPGATMEGLRSVASHPMALAQCEKFFLAHPALQRVPAEDTAGSVRDVLARGDRAAAGIASRRAAERYGGLILAESIQDNQENFTRFVLLVPRDSFNQNERLSPRMDAKVHKLSLALRLAHQPGALLAALRPFADHGINLLKIESRPIHGRPWEYQFFLDVQTEEPARLHEALHEVKAATSFVRILGRYAPAKAS